MLTHPTNLPLYSINTLAGSVLVVAPHPDDETLGCGGAIALLRHLGCAVRVLIVSDGTASHPRSRKYPAPKLRLLRETETLEALAILGVDAAEVTFLRLQDGAVPTVNSPGFATAVAGCHSYIQTVKPQTIFLPWRNDPHGDHRATWMLMVAALESLSKPRMIEYPIWDWDWRQRREITVAVSGWRLDIAEVLETKKEAIAAYRSQTTNLIDDDPGGFRLTPQMLANFTRTWEVYLEVI